MLAAYFNIKTCNDPAPPKPVSQKGKKAPKAGKISKKAKQHVEPFDMCEGSAVHAAFKPPPAGAEPQGLLGSCVMEAEPVEPCADPYEYLWQEADAVVAVAEDEDTDSCVTFEDDVSDMTETLSSSPADAGFDALDKAFFSKRKTRASEAPVYSGPELWYEEDDFIE